jgi:hypothetical protein
MDRKRYESLRQLRRQGLGDEGKIEDIIPTSPALKISSLREQEILMCSIVVPAGVDVYSLKCGVCLVVSVWEWKR